MNRRSGFAIAVLLASYFTSAGVDRVAAQTVCPIDGKGYMLVTVPDNWDDARIVASRMTWQGRRGQLAVLNNVNVQNWVYNQFFPRRPSYVLVGGYRDPNSGNARVGWTWFNPYGGGNFPMSLNSQAWEAGQPDNFRNRENVAAMNFNAVGRFADLSRNGRYWYLVQF